MPREKKETTTEKKNMSRSTHKSEGITLHVHPLSWSSLNHGQMGMETHSMVVGKNLKGFLGNSFMTKLHWLHTLKH
jgi:hypothetical protein